MTDTKTEGIEPSTALPVLTHRRVQGLINRLGPDTVRGIKRTFVMDVAELRALLEETQLRRQQAATPLVFALIDPKTGVIQALGTTEEEAFGKGPKDQEGLVAMPLVPAFVITDA